MHNITFNLDPPLSSHTVYGVHCASPLCYLLHLQIMVHSLSLLGLKAPQGRKLYLFLYLNPPAYSPYNVCHVIHTELIFFFFTLTKSYRFLLGDIISYFLVKLWQGWVSLLLSLLQTECRETGKFSLWSLETLMTSIVTSRSLCTSNLGRGSSPLPDNFSFCLSLTHLCCCLHQCDTAPRHYYWFFGIPGTKRTRMKRTHPGTRQGWARFSAESARVWRWDHQSQVHHQLRKLLWKE